MDPGTTVRSSSLGNIARAGEDNTLTWIARVEPDRDGARCPCLPRQLAREGDLQLSFVGEGTASIRSISLTTSQATVILRCDLSSSTASCQIE